MAIFSSPISSTAAKSFVSTGETTTSTTYTGLTTPNAVTINIGNSGLALVNIECNLSTTSGACAASFAVSGANTIASADTTAIIGSTTNQAFGLSKLLTGLTPGSSTFTMQFRVTAGTGTFTAREISVIPL